MKPGRCRVAGLCGAILTIWWAVGPSPTRAQTTVGSADVHLPIQNAAGLRLLVATDHTSPVLRIVLPGSTRGRIGRSKCSFPSTSQPSNTVSSTAEHLYMSGPAAKESGRSGVSQELLTTTVTSETTSTCSPEQRSRRRRPLPL